MGNPFVGGPPGSGSFLNISAATAGTQVKTGVGQLRTVAINNAASGSIVTLYDGTSTAGTPIATIDGDVQVSLDYGLQFNVGLFVVVTDAPNITVIYA
jgi:hypothetical protein